MWTTPKPGQCVASLTDGWNCSRSAVDAFKGQPLCKLHMQVYVRREQELMVYRLTQGPEADLRDGLRIFDENRKRVAVDLLLELAVKDQTHVSERALLIAVAVQELANLRIERFLALTRIKEKLEQNMAIAPAEGAYPLPTDHPALRRAGKLIEQIDAVLEKHWPE